jgi:formyltetrahydrofolate hydrolase
MDNLGDMYGNALHDLFKGRISNMTIKLSGSNKKRTRTSTSEFYIDYHHIPSSYWRLPTKRTTQQQLQLMKTLLCLTSYEVSEM